jgi:hypothetical protein
MEAIDITQLTKEEQDKLFLELQEKRRNERQINREAYEGLKQNFMIDIMDKAAFVASDVSDFHKYLIKEVEGFRQIMAEYGAISTKQMSFTLIFSNIKLEVKTNKVKRFDERADMAAQRLITFLKAWVQTSDKGTDDPMYQLAMLAIERNSRGDLDYKQISNLYQLEAKFNDPEYSAIMDLFRESHVTEGTATNFYFYKKNELGVWKKIEISFNRL